MILNIIIMTSINDYKNKSEEKKKTREKNTRTRKEKINKKEYIINFYKE